MTLSDYITLSLSILSFLLCVISIITVVITIRQNHKMIENSTRPYISIYNDFTNFQDMTYYIIIKNFGQTSAQITDFSSSIDNWKTYSKYSSFQPFDNIVGKFLAPSQAIRYCINTKPFLENNIEQINFSISYKAGKQSYKETYSVNYASDKNYCSLKANTEDKELKIISYTLQELVEKML